MQCNQNLYRKVLRNVCDVYLQGSRIWDYMHGIPSACEPAPIINAYIELNLQTLESAGLLEPNKAAQENSYGASARPSGVNVTITLQSQLKSAALEDAQCSRQQQQIDTSLQQVQCYSVACVSHLCFENV